MKKSQGNKNHVFVTAHQNSGTENNELIAPNDEARKLKKVMNCLGKTFKFIHKSDLR